MGFGIDPNTFNLSPAQILKSEQNRISLGLAEQRLSLEERAQSLREQAFKFQTTKPMAQSGSRGRGIPFSRGESLYDKQKRESKERSDVAMATQAKRREKAEARISKEQSQKKLAEQYGQAWELTPEGKWRERPKIVEARKLETAKQMKKIKGDGDSYGEDWLGKYK